MRWGVLLGLAALVGCGEEVEPAAVGQASFLYRMNDGGGVMTSCDFSGGTIGAVRLLLGNDTNGNGELDDAEILTQGESACNQADPFGSFGPVTVEAGDYDILAVELLDDQGQLVGWFAPSVVNVELLTRNSFARGVVTVPVDGEVVIPFDDAGSTDFELQISL